MSARRASTLLLEGERPQGSRRGWWFALLDLCFDSRPADALPWIRFRVYPVRAPLSRGRTQDGRVERGGIMLRRRLVAFRPYMLFLVGAIVALGLMFAYLRLEPPKGKYDDSDIKKLVAEQMASATPSPPVAPQLYAQIQPSVVLITTREVPPGKPEAATGIGLGVVAGA